MIGLILKTHLGKLSYPLLRLPKDSFCSEFEDQDMSLALSQKEKDETLAEVHNFISILAQNHKNDDLFWYTPISEMQPFMSSVLRAFEIRASLLKNIHKLKGKFCLSDPDILLLNFIKKSIFLHIKIINSKEIFILHKLILLKRYVLRYTNIVFWLIEHFSYIRNSKKINTFPTHINYLLVSRFETTQEGLLQEKTWVDQYLGDMPELLAQNADIAIIGRCGGSPKKLSENLSKFTRFPIWTIYQYLSFKDLILIMWKSLRFTLNINYIEDRPLALLAYHESRNHCRAIADCLLVEFALKNLLKHISVDKIITMQENCSWESAVIVARNKCSPKTHVVGYFHCPIIPESLRYHANQTILKCKRLPDKILALGPKMSDAMNKLGEWGDLLMDGYAFRTPLNNITLRERNITNKILVLLGGNYSNVSFLRWLNEALRKENSNNWQFIIKGHPRLPAKEFLEKAGILYGQDKLFNPLDSNIPFSEVLVNVSCVVYKGTTAGIVGLAAGLPTIHICHNALATDNVLFNAGELSISVNNANDFKNELEKVSYGLAPNKNARDYALSYYDQSKEAKEKTLSFLENLI